MAAHNYILLSYSHSLIKQEKYVIILLQIYSGNSFVSNEGCLWLSGKNILFFVVKFFFGSYYISSEWKKEWKWTLLQDQENFGVYHSEQRVCKWKGSSGSTRLKGPYPPLCRKKWGNRGPLNLLSILPNFFCVVRKRLMGKLYVNGRFHLWEHFSGTKNYNVKVFLLTETLTGGIFSIWVVTNNDRQWTASKDLYPPIIMSLICFCRVVSFQCFPQYCPSRTVCIFIEGYKEAPQ